jgi:hypothetical protein
LRIAQKLLAKFVDGASDAQLERRFGSPLALRVIFAAMARSFVPAAAGGFQGALSYELGLAHGPPARWTIEVLSGRAVARPGGVADAALTLHFSLADFIRIAAGALDPAVPLLQRRASFEGDFALAAQLPEMFGAPSTY